MYAQTLNDTINSIPWKKIVLNNNARFRHHQELNRGSGFLFKYHGNIIACTARDFTGTIYTQEEMIKIRDFDEEVASWKMFVTDDPSMEVILDTLVLKNRIEKTFSVFMYSMPFLTFSVREKHEAIIALEPDINRIRNGTTLYLAGYDDDHNLRIVTCVVETALNEKYADGIIRVKTDDYLHFDDFVGAPIINGEGKAVGVINRAYALKKNKKGRIISHDKEVEGAYFEFFVNGTPMRDILGKDYIP